MCVWWCAICDACVSSPHPVEVVEDVGGIARPEARRGHADDGHVVGDLHLLLHAGQVVGLVLAGHPGGHVAELHGSVVQPLRDGGKHPPPPYRELYCVGTQWLWLEETQPPCLG